MASEKENRVEPNFLALIDFASGLEDTKKREF